MKLVLDKGQNIYFTSDTHYNHSNICRATTKWDKSDNLTRDFKSLEHMNDVLVNNINEMVMQDDILIHLGDWSFGGFEKISEFRDRIFCKNIHLVAGNHDHHIVRNKEGIQKIFSSVREYLNLDLRIPKGKEVEIINIICMHYPISTWDSMNKGIIHLHGHVHLPQHLRVAEGRAMDVGVDGNNYYPISIGEIMKIMNGRPIRRLVIPKDHHEII